MCRVIGMGYIFRYILKPGKRAEKKKPPKAAYRSFENPCEPGA
jgi:hypothetical protein